MKKLNINKQFATLALAGTMAITGCSITNNKDKKPTFITTQTVDIKYNISEGTKEYIFKKTTTDGKNTYSNVSTKKEPMLLSEYEITRIISKEEIIIREKPNSDSNVISTVPEGTVLQSVYFDGEWYRVILDNEIGYVNSEYVYEEIDKKGKEFEREIINRDNIEIETKTYVEATEAVNIRNDATAESSKVGLLAQGQKLEAIKILDNGWYEVNYNGNSSYVKGDYVKEIKEEKIISPFIKKVMFTKDSNIYSYNNINEIIDTVPTYEVAFVYNETNNMYLAQVNDRLVYINKDNTLDLNEKMVIIDISDQNAKLYNGNEILIDTPIVSGHAYNSPSDIGLFDIVEKREHTYLEGPGYKSFVDYWMAYNGNEGIHDAEVHYDNGTHTHYDIYGNYIEKHGWREPDEFNTYTYQVKGSHGCINTPNEPAKEFYKQLEIGDLVLVKK